MANTEVGDRMASIRKQGDRYEIRECVETPRGPRQLSLTSFRGVLTPEVLDEAEAKARKPLRRVELTARAIRLGIPVSERRRHPEARRLLALLQRGAELEPTLVQLLEAALQRLESRAVPEHLAFAFAGYVYSPWLRGDAVTSDMMHK
jgi:hypothetical protein